MLHQVDVFLVLETGNKSRNKYVKTSKDSLYYKFNMLMTFQRGQKGQKIDVLTGNTASPV